MKHHWLILVVVLAATASLASAGVIVSAEAVAADPTVTVVDSKWDAPTESLYITENVSGQPATVLATFTAIGDPSAWIRKRVDNNTAFAWAGYIIDIKMLQSFTIDSVIPMANWTGVATPVLPDGEGYYAATVNFTTETPGSYVTIGSTGQFNVRVTFPGTAEFGITQTPVAPEPISLALLALGGLMIRRRSR
jgi:hypothetical protein